ncbi:ZIP family metal transporter [Candidatus Dojkabacteria bacterium]|nr:ZIP family metal transporter [Candidatus Dojkabacteria bacterium]
MPFVYTLISTILISLIAFVGLIILFFSDDKIKKIVEVLLAFSAGALIGGAFFHLLPESVDSLGSDISFFTVLVSFVFFFIIEKTLFWHHCHNGNCNTHSYGTMNLIGDSFHNFIDGLVIAAAYVASIPLGISTTIAVIIHEVPQEIGDFGAIIHSGWDKKRALIMNFLVALFVVLGGIVGLVATAYIDQIVSYLMAFTAGGFIYISSSDLIPELKKGSSLKKSLFTVLVFVFGIMMMYLLKYIE